MYGISGFIFALFLRTVSEIIFAPYGLRRATLSFLKINVFTLCANVLLPNKPFQMEAGLLVAIISFLYGARDIFIIMVDTGAFKSTLGFRPI